MRTNGFAWGLSPLLTKGGLVCFATGVFSSPAKSKILYFLQVFCHQTCFFTRRLLLYSSSDGPELIEPSHALTFARCFMSSSNVVVLKGPSKGAMWGHPDHKSPHYHSNFVTFHMHSICRRRKSVCSGPINTVAPSVTWVGNIPTPKLGLHSKSAALQWELSAFAKELLLRYAKDSSDETPLPPPDVTRYIHWSDLLFS